MALHCEWHILTGTKDACTATDVPECFTGNKEYPRQKPQPFTYDLCRKHYDMVMYVWFRVKR